MSQERQDTTDVMEQSNKSENTSATSTERKKQPKALQRRPQPTYNDEEDSELDDFVMPPPRKNKRMIPVHQSRISDRVQTKGAEDSSLKIKIELDLEVEVELYARVKGDVTIGLLTE